MKLDENEAKQIAKKIDEEGALYVKKYIVPIKDDLLLVLKTHLIIEKLIEEILSAMLVKPDEIIEMNFFRKIQIIEALGIKNNNIIVKLKALNSLRNKFAHNLDYKIKNEDLSIFFSYSTLKRANNISLQLIQIAAWTIYFLMSAREFYLDLPFYMQCNDNKERLKRDKGFDIDAINEIYNRMNLDAYINAMRLPQ